MRFAPDGYMHLYNETSVVVCLDTLADGIFIFKTFVFAFRFCFFLSFLFAFRLKRKLQQKLAETDKFIAYATIQC